MTISRLKKALAAFALFLGLTGFVEPVEPVEYVRVGDLYGPGYYYIPGTETALKIGGHVRFATGTRINFDSRVCENYGSGAFTLPQYPRYDGEYVDDTLDALDDLTNSEFLAVMDWWWGDGPNPFYLGLGNPAVGRAMDYLYDATEAEGWDIWDEVADRDEYLYYARQNQLWMYNRLAMNWGRIGLPMMMLFNPYMVMVAKGQLDNLTDGEFHTLMNWLWGEGPSPMNTSLASQKMQAAMMALFWLNNAELQFLMKATEARDTRILDQVNVIQAFALAMLQMNSVVALPYGKTGYNPANVLNAKSNLDALNDQEFLAVMDWLWDDGPSPLAIGFGSPAVEQAMGSIYYMSNAEIWQLIKMTEARDDRLYDEREDFYSPPKLGAVAQARFDAGDDIVGSGPRFSGSQQPFAYIQTQYAYEETEAPKTEQKKGSIDWDSFSPGAGLSYQIREGISLNVKANYDTPAQNQATPETTQQGNINQGSWGYSNLTFKIEESVQQADQSDLNPAENTVVKLGFPIPEKPVPGNQRTDEGAGQDPVQGTIDEFQQGLVESGSQFNTPPGNYNIKPGQSLPDDQGVRYTSPTFAGFQVGANWGEEDHWDTALRYAGEFGGFRLAAGVGHGEYDEVPKEPAGGYSSAKGAGLPFDSTDYDPDTNIVNPTGIQHVPTGLFVPGQVPEDFALNGGDLNQQALGNFAALFLKDPEGDQKPSTGQPEQPLTKRPDEARTNWAGDSRWNLGVGYEFQLQPNYLDSKIVYTDEDSQPEDLGSLNEYALPSFKLGGFNLTPLFFPRSEGEDVENKIASNDNILDDEENDYREKLADDPYFTSRGSWGQDYPDQWAIQRVGYTTGSDSAWAAAGENLAQVIVAVIDTGLDWNHADISWDSIWLNEDEIDQNGIDDDGNGYIDDIVGWDFFYNTNLPWDEDGHGTFVAGVIAAQRDNGIGISGINPAARIMVLKAVDNFGHTRASYLAEAIKYATDNGARIINLSVGGRDLTKAEKLAVDYAWENNVLVIAAAGNTGENAENFGFVPYDSVLSVASLNPEDQKSGFSNWGEGIDLAAPGEDILSLRARRTDLSLNIQGLEYELGENYVGDDRRYYRAAGTSFSTPIVAGTASLILSRNPNLTAAEVRRMLEQSAHDVDVPGRDQFTGFGMLDAKAAITADPAFEILANIVGVEVIQDGGVFVAVNGIATANHFDKAQLYIGRGENPGEWKAVGKGFKKPVSFGRLDQIPAAEFQGSQVWIIRLVVTHSNGQTREERFVLNLG